MISQKSLLLVLRGGMILCLGACMKSPDLNQNFGVPVAGQDLGLALQKAQSQATMTSTKNIKKGEFAYFERTNQVENSLPLMVKQRAETVIDRNEDNKKIIFTINHQLREIDSDAGEMKPSQTQSKSCLEKTDGACDGTAALLDVTQFFSQKAVHALDSVVSSYSLGDLSWHAFAVKAQDANNAKKWTYYNLQRSVVTVPVPPLVGMRGDCGGRLKSCNLPMELVQISFDQVDWSSEQYPVKYSYVMAFSSEAPYFASQVTSCGWTTVPSHQQRVAFMQCEILKDFTVGHD